MDQRRRYNMKQNIILIDIDRCIGCNGCIVACKTQNNVPLGKPRNELYTMGPTGKYPNLEMYFITVMCQQCANPSCAEVCPTGACYRNDEDGVVYIDRDKCIGCRKCVKACPYEAILFNKELRVADKCDFCANSREDGENPACVKNCAGSAMFFGDKNDPNSEVAKKIREAGSDNIYTLQNNGTNPSVCYILRNEQWIETLPHDYVKQIRRVK